jgi:hypothetical protein
LESAQGNNLNREFVEGGEMKKPKIHYCLVCANPTPWFYLIQGSRQWHMQSLINLGVDPEAAMMIAGSSNTDSHQSFVCREHLSAFIPLIGEPANQTDIDLLLDSGYTGPLPVSVIAEKAPLAETAIPGMSREYLKEHEDGMARIKGAQKDIADLVEELTAKGYFAIHNGGHIKIFEHEGGAFMTTLSGTPNNAKRAVANARSQVQRYEREHGLGEKDEEMGARGAVYNKRSDAEKASIVARYDSLPASERRAFLIEEEVRPEYIPRWRLALISAGWEGIQPFDEPEPEDAPDVQRQCAGCKEDKALTREHYSLYRQSGKWFWEDVCLECKNPVKAEPVKVTPASRKPAVVTETRPVDTEAQNMMTLLTRKRELEVALGGITGEKAVREKELRDALAALDAEFAGREAGLRKELDEVQTSLLEAIA